MNDDLFDAVFNLFSPAPKKRKSRWRWKLSQKAAPSVTIPSKGSVLQSRPIRLIAPLYDGLGAGLSFYLVASGVATQLQEWRLDHNCLRLALLVATPFIFCMSLFYTLQIVTTLSMVFGPTAQYYENSKYYSAVRPEPNPEVDQCLPHIRIEIPVYKESLEMTIAPSILSLEDAMQTYTRQGGTSAIFVHDDGLQGLNAADRDKRIAFYADHNIGWVARPPHSDDAGGYKRLGRFRKGSNMNYGLALSMCMEKHIKMLKVSGYNGADPLEDHALELAIEETYQKTGKRWKPWAKNARSLCVGDIVLIVDADTIVPNDCFRDAARELAECPEVAIIQHESDVMQVAHHFFENGLAYFTRRMNKCISLACANGEMAPFVGHNAFLRWSAFQDAAFVDPADGIKKIWSETHVSEDFELALRVQLKNYTIRWANYSGGGFKEGVSLTVDDELNRWKKIAFGCNELMFNPVKDWWYLGPITKQLRVFLWSNAPFHYKISMLAYMSSYYGIATSPFLSLLNYLVWGWSFDPVTVVFTAASNVSYTILEYRLGQCGIVSALFENLSFVPFLWFFFSGLSIHLWYALLAHLFSFDITWGATKKEVERSNFWREGPRIIRRYWVVFLTSGVALTAIVLPSTPLVRASWRIEPSWAVLPPLITVAAGHILVPFVLNPWFMIFSC